MGMKDENEPLSGTLGQTLYELGLITADELRLQEILNSREYKDFERWLKTNRSWD